MSTAASDGLYFSSLALAIDYDFVSRQPFYQYASHYFTKSSFTLQTQITHHHQHFRDNSRNKIGSSTSNVSGLNSADGTRIASALALNFATNTARLLHHHNDSTCQPYCLTFALLCFAARSTSLQHWLYFLVAETATFNYMYTLPSHDSGTLQKHRSCLIPQLCIWFYCFIVQPWLNWVRS